MTNLNLAAINERFGIDGHLSFKKGPGGLAIAEIGNLHASATIFLQGAHLASWTPRRQQPVIWLSPLAQFVEGKPIRGGIPVCWPWFAANSNGANLPFHGIARTAPWDVLASGGLDDGATRLVLRLPSTEDSQKICPHPTPVEIYYTVGNTLAIELVTRNEGSEPVVVGQALHTYFHVGNVNEISIHGLDGCSYLDKLDHDRRKPQQGPLKVSAEIDRIYLDAGADCHIADPILNRRIVIGKQGSHSTIVWNPGPDKSKAMADMGQGSHANLVCVETANAADDVVTIPPGSEHKLAVCYRVESL